MAEVLHLTEPELDEIVLLILNLQTKFLDLFSNHILEKRVENGKIFFRLRKKERKEFFLDFDTSIDKSIGPLTIKLEKRYAKILSDIILTWKALNKYKGFDINNRNTMMIKNIKELINLCPYLFEINREDGLAYPTELASRLGDSIFRLSKNNKMFTEIPIENFTFDFS